MKNRHYLDWVRQQPCVICHVFNEDNGAAHHPIGCNGTGMVGGKAASDFLAIKLCQTDNGDGHSHSSLHNHGHRTWETKFGPQLAYSARTMEQAIFEGKLVFK